ncbi:hypothetical protein CDL15_Pgr007263 [Punica granatum]|uniref:Uncharacterized protein n=1 Tax=Punica granatum TaxID=22663 RepID=A0A218X8X5_PUNGR|nr:hypothetical protein CDL15_Pgr007263 [Punica granatum]
MGRAREEGNAGGDDDGRRGGFRQTRVAISTLGRRGDGAGGSGEHRLGYAVLGGASRGSGRLGIEEIFGIRRVRFREEFRRDREIPSVFGGPRVGSPGRAKRESERSQFQRDRDREGEIAVEGTCRGSERWRVGRACQRWQAVAVGGQPRRVGGGRGTSVKEEEKKRGEKRREGKSGGGGKEEEEKKRGRSGKK